jgi:hypothetical protein
MSRETESTYVVIKLRGKAPYPEQLVSERRGDAHVRKHHGEIAAAAVAAAAVTVSATVSHSLRFVVVAAALLSFFVSGKSLESGAA